MHYHREFTCKRDVTLADPQRKISCSLGYKYLWWKFLLQIFFILYQLHFHANKLKFNAFFVPRFRESVGTLNLIRPSVCLSVCHKNFNLGHNFCTITDRALKLGMCVPCDETFPEVPCRDLDGDLWPTSRSNLLPSGGPQFSEFACKTSCILDPRILLWKTPYRMLFSAGFSQLLHISK